MPPGFPKTVTGKDGYPAEGHPGWQSANGRARYYQPQAAMQGIAALLAMETDKPVVDAAALKGKYEIHYYVTENGYAARHDEGDGAGARQRRPYAGRARFDARGSS
jgi:uncharacterized protein (TIGR03435 family)